MARFQQKPLDQLSPAYRQRIERNLAKGLTRSQARGHTKKSELAPKDITIPIQQITQKTHGNGYWALREVRRVIAEKGQENPEVQKLVRDYKKAISSKDHHTTDVRNIFRSIKEATKRYRPGEDLDFVVEGWY